MAAAFKKLRFKQKRNQNESIYRDLFMSWKTLTLKIFKKGKNKESPGYCRLNSLQNCFKRTYRKAIQLNNFGLPWTKTNLSSVQSRCRHIQQTTVQQEDNRNRSLWMVPMQVIYFIYILDIFKERLLVKNSDQFSHR